MSNARIRRKRAKRRDALLTVFFGKLDGNKARKLAKRYGLEYRPVEFTGLEHRYEGLSE